MTKCRCPAVSPFRWRERIADECALQDFLRAADAGLKKSSALSHNMTTRQDRGRFYANLPAYTTKT